MDIKNILFEDGQVTIVYSESHDVKPWGKQTKLLEVDMINVEAATRQFQSDCNDYVDAILVALRDG